MSDLSSVAVYPLLLEPFLSPRPWGGRLLATRLNKPLPPDEPIGESWEIFWKNRVTNGPFAGNTLGEVIALHPKAMTGSEHADSEFPLLIKFLDPEEWLSVQVHPDDEMAQKLEGEPRGKTECWFVIDAAPGAQLAFGLAQPMDSASLRAAIAEGRAKEVLQYVPLSPGDFIFVPAGTMHALGPGLLIYELQQTSDTTYRVYDWDRVGLDGKPRALHLDKALACTHYTVNPPAKRPYQFQPGEGFDAAPLIRGQYFALDLLNIREACPRDTRGERAHLLTVIAGQVVLHAQAATAGEPLPLPLGTSAFIPAGIGAYRLVGQGRVLCAWPA